MLVMIHHPHDWSIKPVVGDVWGRENLRVGMAVAVSSAHFKIISVDTKCIRILHTGRRSGLVSRSDAPTDSESIETGSEVSLGVNDRYFFMDAWKSIYFRVDDQEELVVSKKDEVGKEAAADKTSDDDFIVSDKGDFTQVAAAAGSIVRSMFNRIKKQSTSCSEMPPPLVSTPCVPKLRRMMAANLKKVMSDQTLDEVDTSCGFRVGDGFHSSTRIKNDIIPAPVMDVTAGGKKKKRKISPSP